jgi:ArsR family transcriptional regulator
MKGPIDPDVRLLQAAADPARLEILRQLAAIEAICACDFTDCCGVSQPTVSHHLKVLRSAGWVRSERRRNSIFYRLDPLAVERFGAIVAGLGSAPGNRSGGLGVAGTPLPVIQPV